MKNTPIITRRVSAALVGLATLVQLACSDRPFDQPMGPGEPQFSVVDARGIDEAIAAQERHTEALLRIPGVLGTAVGLLPNGRVGVRVFLQRPNVPVPSHLDGIPVGTEVTGLFMAHSDPTSRQRPAPLGFSVGHPEITAGSIGARVLDGAGNVFLLSNNHVLANGNDALIGDPALQPGPFDGGTLADQFGSLAAFQPIDFSGADNTMDAAIASSSTGELGNATPADAGYGTPNSAIYGDANGDGLFDNRNALLGLNVQKYGRTTLHTHGQITAVNATVDICYEVFGGVLCTKSARFVDQLIIEPGSFSGGGDSGSLIVSDDGSASPVGLLFAGSSTHTIANRIDLVLDRFGVTIDGVGSEPPPPPEPFTDIEISDVSAPASAPGGDLVDVVVTVSNSGNQDVATSFAVSLEDLTDAVPIGTQNVDGLVAGASVNLTFSWNTSGVAFGDHLLAASHDLPDDDPTNDQDTTRVTLTDPDAVVVMHIGDLDGLTSNDGSTWSAIVEVTAHDGSHGPLNGATVVGMWSQGGLASDTCTTGELGGNGTCIFLFPGLPKKVHSVSFAVTSVTAAGQTYDAGLNHDDDGSSDGTTIVVRR